LKILVTGCAGFIGFHTVLKLLKEEQDVIGIDNVNNYYDTSLKKSRLTELNRSKHNGNYQFIKGDLSNKEFLKELFLKNNFDVVIHLAAQAGVRYSINSPQSYVESNLIGFMNILETVRNSDVKHFVFASSSSVYGLNEKIPFAVEDPTNCPVSLYAATKKSNEVLAYSYSHLYKIPMTGMRFFTVYGPFGRPDMAYYSFTEKISSGKPIEVYNNGEMYRDFTYIDDVTEAIGMIYKQIPESKDHVNSKSKAPYILYNIGNNNPVSLKEFIGAIERATKKKSIQIHKPMQPGDVYQTYADIEPLMNDFNLKPKININEGVVKFVDWYNSYREKKF
tara:strand:- start:138 stop:1142 length:1005 start_codon:yes stop_codon:yes gene_type:complete